MASALVPLPILSVLWLASLELKNSPAVHVPLETPLLSKTWDVFSEAFFIFREIADEHPQIDLKQ